jgi:hypothetical protein
MCDERKAGRNKYVVVAAVSTQNKQTASATRHKTLETKCNPRNPDTLYSYNAS